MTLHVGKGRGLGHMNRRPQAAGGGPADVPSNTSAPTFSGTLAEGQTLTGNDGSWSNPPILSYARKWQRADDGSGTGAADIAGATGQTYVPTSADSGKYIRFGSRASNAVGAAADYAWSAWQAALAFPLFLFPSFSGYSVDAGDAPVYDTALENADLATGCMTLDAADQLTLTYTAPTTGKIRYDLWFRDDSTTTATSSTNATTNLYFRLNTAAVGSGNAAAYVSINRNTADGATAKNVVITYRNGAAFANAFTVRRDGAPWWMLSVVLDVDANTYDLYINGVRWLRDLVFPSTTKTTSGSLTILNGSTAPTTAFDNIEVITGWTLPAETTLVSDDFTTGSGAIEASSPTETRNIHVQKWISPTNTVVGTFTRSASGLTYPAKSTFALARCSHDGIFESRWKMATSGDRYAGILFRAWEGPDVGLGTSTAMYIARYTTASASQVALLGYTGSGIGGIATRSTPTMAIAAGDEIDIKVEARGRTVDVYMRNVTAGGSYVLQLSHTVTSTSNGGRGILQQENAGPYVDGDFGAVGSTNYCKSFTYTGRKPDLSTDVTVGHMTVNIEPGSVRELYSSNSGEPTTNLFWDAGVQLAHRGEMEISESHNVVQKTVIDATNVKAYRQRGILISEYAVGGVGECYLTFLRRGPWFADRTYMWGTATVWAPDNDFRPPALEAAGSYKWIDAGGTITTANYTPYHDWREDDTSSTTFGFQVLAAHASAPIRATVAHKNNENAAVTYTLRQKATGSAAPFSLNGWTSSVPSDSTSLEIARAWLVEAGSGLALDDTTLSQFRVDVHTPATLTFTTGSLKTNAAGDLNTDGFNERHGWHEITCAGGVASFTLPVASGKRFMAAFRLWSHTLGASPTVVIAGSAGVAGTDYVWDDLGDGTGVLQLLTNRTADTTVALS